MRAAFPQIERFLGAFRIPGPVQMRVNDLHVVENHVRDGVVLIGDAFQTSCPAAGTGIGRLLSDIDRLCNHHLPGWLASPGMDAAKIASFYDDPEKRAFDARTLHIAEDMCSAATETGLRWNLHRRRVLAQRRLRGWMAGMADGFRRGRVSAARA